MVLPFFDRSSLADHARQLRLRTYVPEIALTGLQPGVDNVRHDVYLSPKLVEITRAHIAYLIEKHGGVEDLLREDAKPKTQSTVPAFMRRSAQAPTPTELKPTERAAEFKRMLSELQVAALNVAKAEGNVSIDLLLRVAIVKLFRTEVGHQFSQVLERCRARLKNLDSSWRASARAVEFRDRFMQLQVSKKIVLRKAAQELFAVTRDVEKETVARMRRSLFGEPENPAYDLFINRLMYTSDARDDYLNAEQYVMLGNYDRDPDRFPVLVEIALDFLNQLELSSGEMDSDVFADALLNVPENAQELVGGGAPQDGSPKTKAQKALLTAWSNGLEQAGVMGHVIAAYEVIPLLGEYTPVINPQQLKNALISRTERKRVEALLQQHGKISPEKLNQAVKRVEAYSGSDKQKIAGRFLCDFMRYHRDMRRFESVMAALDTANVVGNEKLRELSAINNTLYEFLLPEEQKPAEDRVMDHIILKADVRDSTLLTRTLLAKGLNPASYFSLNFYEPINKLLPKYEATKVFIEGDAVILAMFEREGEPGFGVARTCMLAREMIEVVSAYNEKSVAMGLPPLELGIGICYQGSAPMYLMDGSNRIMISQALNESDRLSSCSKGSRKFLTGRNLPFNVFSFQTVEDADTGGTPDEFLMRYNVGGIHLNQVAFNKLAQEISLQEFTVTLPMLWGDAPVRLFSGLVPIATGVFHRIVVRESAIPHINAADFAVKCWTDRKYYEVCTSRAVYELVEETRSMSARA